MSILKSIGKIAKGALGGLVSGGLPGAMTGGLMAATSKKSKKKGYAIQTMPGVGATPMYTPPYMPSLSSIPAASTAALLPALPSLPSVVSGIGTAISLARKALPAATAIGGGAAVMDYVIDKATGMMRPKKKYRRLNPLNPRAANRAIHRIKSLRKITAKIERQLPRARSRAPGRGRK